MFKATDPVTFADVKTKYATLSTTVKDNLIDPRFRDLIDRINAHPHLATLHCCSGHTQFDDSRNKVKYPVGAYAVFLFTPVVESKIRDLYNHLYQHCQIMPDDAKRPDITKNGGFYWQLEEANTGVFGMWDTPASRADGFALYSWIGQPYDPTGSKTVEIWTELLTTYLGI